MRNNEYNLFVSDKKKPSFAEWTMQNGVSLNQTTTKPLTLGEVAPKATERVTSSAKTTTTPTRQTRDPFLEGFYSTEDKPETERKTYRQHRTPINAERPKTNSTYRQTNPYGSPVKIVGNNVTEKDYEDFWNAFRNEGAESKLNRAAGQMTNFTEPHKTLEKYYIDDKYELNQERKKADEVFRVLDDVTAKTRAYKKKHLPQIEFQGFLSNPIGNIIVEPIKRLHYSRNELNKSAPKSIPEAEAMGWLMEKKDHCHQVGVPGRTNVKYIPSDGSIGEQIFKADGTVDTSPENMATPNIVSPQESLIGHSFLDVAPWVLWGNSPEDSTTMLERIVMPSAYWLYEKAFNPDNDNPDNYDM